MTNYEIFITIHVISPDVLGDNLLPPKKCTGFLYHVSCHHFDDHTLASILPQLEVPNNSWWKSPLPEFWTTQIAMFAWRYRQKKPSFFWAFLWNFRGVYFVVGDVGDRWGILTQDYQLPRLNSHNWRKKSAWRPDPTAYIIGKYGT